MSNHLYHFSPRKFESPEKAVSIVKSIFENGLYLSRETLEVNWKDKYAMGNKIRDLSAIQLRFCLTAITNTTELKAHASKFGVIGFEFEEDFIVKIGGFPVFYVPTPRDENAGIEDYKGVSLLYRLADAQEVLQYVVDHNLIQTKDIDIENVLGSIKFLANLCYPTQRKTEKRHPEQINYYNQREWRVIHDLTPEKVSIGCYQNNHTIKAFENKPIRNFITRILVFEIMDISENTCRLIAEQVEELVLNFGLTCKVELIAAN